LWRLTSSLDFTPLREVVRAQVRADLDSKAVKNDRFAGGVLTIDGKGLGGGLGLAPNSLCRQSTCDAQGTPSWDCYAVRACLTSSISCPLLDQEFVRNGEGEATVAYALLERVIGAFPKLFRIVTADAGFTGRAFAEYLGSRGKHYMLALKGKHPRHFNTANELLDATTRVLEVSERAQGRDVHRELRRAAVGDSFDFPRSKEVWRVRQTHYDAEGKRVFDEARIFISSQNPEDVSDQQALDLIRLHWGIENGSNWTMDMILKEDTRLPCAKGFGVVVMSWLRILAYNLMAVFRAHLPRRDRRLVPWRATQRRMFIALIKLGTEETSRAQRA
jgi:hypothetical protein